MIAGIGCRAGCAPEEIVALIAEASARAGRVVSALAVPDFKRGEHGPREAARTLSLPLLLVDQDALLAAQLGCPTRSDAAMQVTGIASVAEGCALAAAGSGGRLVLARIAGPRATCALAEGAA